MVKTLIKSRLSHQMGDVRGNVYVFLMSLIRNAAIGQTNVIKSQQDVDFWMYKISKAECYVLAYVSC